MSYVITKLSYEQFCSELKNSKKLDVYSDIKLLTGYDSGISRLLSIELPFNAVLMLEHLISLCYRWDTTFFRLRGQIEINTRLSAYKQRIAEKILIKNNLIKVFLERKNKKTFVYFRINHKKIKEFALEIYKNLLEQTVPNSPYEMRKKAKKAAKNDQTMFETASENDQTVFEIAANDGTSVFVVASETDFLGGSQNFNDTQNGPKIVSSNPVFAVKKFNPNNKEEVLNIKYNSSTLPNPTTPPIGYYSKPATAGYQNHNNDRYKQSDKKKRTINIATVSASVNITKKPGKKLIQPKTKKPVVKINTKESIVEKPDDTKLNIREKIKLKKNLEIYREQKERKELEEKMHNLNPKIEEIITLWNSLRGLPKHTNRTTKTFSESVTYIDRLLKGNMFSKFNSLKDTEHDRRYSVEEIKDGILNYWNAKTSPSFYPKDKNNFGKLSLNSFLYSPNSSAFVNSNSRGPLAVSRFLWYLNNPPKAVDSIMENVKEKNPTMTQFLIDAWCAEVYASEDPDDWTEYERKGFALGANYLQKAMDELLDTVFPPLNPRDWCVYAIRAVKKEFGDIKLGNIHSKYTYTRVLPKYLKDRGRITASEKRTAVHYEPW